jgi:Holliday junction resolvasome RuvABC endonuclease subunit
MGNSKATHFVGIDPSLSSTGLAVLTFHDGKIDQYTTTLKTPTNLRETARLCWIRGAFVQTLEANTYGLMSGVCYEKASLGSVGRQIDLAELRGVLQVACVSFAMNPIGIEPARLKKFGAGQGGASKDKMIQRAKTSGWAVANDDEADAAHLAFLAFAIKHHKTIRLTRKQLEVLSDLGITL